MALTGHLAYALDFLFRKRSNGHLPQLAVSGTCYPSQMGHFMIIKPL